MGILSRSALQMKETLRCSQCLKKFTDRRNLTVHTKIVHNKETPHACPQPGCAQKFGLKLDLKRHMMKVHGFEKPHTCVEQNCDEKFLQLQDLKVASAQLMEQLSWFVVFKTVQQHSQATTHSSCIKGCIK